MIGYHYCSSIFSEAVPIKKQEDETMLSLNQNQNVKYLSKVRTKKNKEFNNA